MNTPNWPALKTYDCPRCGSKLHFVGFLSDELACSKDGCGFKILETRLQEIVTNMTRKRRRCEPRVEEELEGLPRL